jgi:hypothetical protein
MMETSLRESVERDLKSALERVEEMELLRDQYSALQQEHQTLQAKHRLLQVGARKQGFVRHSR